MDLLLPDQRARQLYFFLGHQFFVVGGGGVQLATFPNAFFSSFLLDFDLTSFFIHTFFLSYGMEYNYTQHVVFCCTYSSSLSAYHFIFLCQ